MIGVQILAILFVLWMTYFSFLHFKRHEFTIYEYTVWQLLWIGLAVIVMFPGTTRIITRTLGFYRAFDFLTVGGIVILFGIVFRMYVLQRRLQRQMENLVRSIAIKK
jgi:hypothetical protein